MKGLFTGMQSYISFLGDVECEELFCSLPCEYK